jgi:tripartite-type tricarboxylate transporter receptor subunit TctC
VLKLNYDVVNDFTPISLIADTPIWIVSRKSLPADDLKGFIAWLKASNGKATMGMAGIGSPSEFAARIFAKETGTTFQFVPYRGGAPLLQDMIGDHVDFAFGQAAGYLTYRPERPAQSVRGIAIQPLVGGPRGADTR